MRHIEIGPRIREARLFRSITQGKLGSLIGVDATTISCWERGVTGVHLAAIATALKVPIDWLITGQMPCSAEESTKIDLLRENRMLKDKNDQLARLVLATHSQAVRAETN